MRFKIQLRAVFAATFKGTLAEAVRVIDAPGVPGALSKYATELELYLLQSGYAALSIERLPEEMPEEAVTAPLPLDEVVKIITPPEAARMIDEMIVASTEEAQAAAATETKEDTHEPERDDNY
jgi:hypothetical protein